MSLDHLEKYKENQEEKSLSISIGLAWPPNFQTPISSLYHSHVSLLCLHYSLMDSPGGDEITAGVILGLLL